MTGFWLSTNVLLAELPAGDPTKATKNTGAKNSQTMDAPRDEVGERDQITEICGLSVAMQPRAANAADALAAGNGQAALEVVQPELTIAIEQRALEMRKSVNIDPLPDDG